MSKSATFLGLVAVAAAGIPAYGSSEPAGYSSAAPASGSSSSWAQPAASSSVGPASYPSGSASWSASSGPASASAPSYSGSWVPSSSVPSSSVSYSPVSSSAAPTPTPSCWTECFQESGITSESQLCGNAEVDTCIHDKCDCEETWAYFSWYNDYCQVPSSSYVVPSSSYVASSSYSVSPVSSSSVPASATPTVECWGKCFAENDITSESELCGNTAVDACISQTCDCEEDKAYWAWYESYCTAVPSSSVSASPSYTVPVVPASSTAVGCWDKCFEEAGIASESELCGNTAVDQCIHDTCSPAEDKAYWQWYDSYCTPTSPVTTPCVTPVTTTPATTTPASSVPTDNCWTECFTENDVTSEASLCGNDAVSQCIHDTCSAQLDKAYWDWYNSFCAAESSSVVTITTVITPTTSPASPVTTTYEVTSGYSWAPVQSSPATGVPVPPAAPPAPYSGYSAAATGAAAPTGYASATAAAPSASQWAPAPATGGSSATKPGLVLAAAMAFAALF